MTAWRSISPYLAFAVALSVGATTELNGIVRHPDLTPWVVLVAYAMSQALLLVLLPKK